jgi:hypothetical protein
MQRFWLLSFLREKNSIVAPLRKCNDFATVLKKLPNDGNWCQQTSVFVTPLEHRFHRDRGVSLRQIYEDFEKPMNSSNHLNINVPFSNDIRGFERSSYDSRLIVDPVGGFFTSPFLLYQPRIRRVYLKALSSDLIKMTSGGQRIGASSNAE